MAQKKSSGSKRPAASKDSNKPKREYKPRKPPIERAARLCGLLAKNQGSLAANVIKWQGTAVTNSDQKLALSKIGSALKSIGEGSKAIAESLLFLQKSGYTPKLPSAGRQKMAVVGADVIIKPKFYDPEAHGDVNEFKIAQITEKGYAKLVLRDDEDGDVVCTVPTSRLGRGASEPDEEIHIGKGGNSAASAAAGA